MAAATAFVGLFDKSGAGIKPPFDGPTVDPSNGETPSIFIIGGSGSIGQAAIQFARITGFKRIVTTAKEEYTSYLEGLGATNVLDRFTTKDGAQVMKIAPDIRIVFDTISDGDTLDLALSVLSKKGGTVVRTLPYDGITPIPKNVDLKFVLGELHWNQSHLGPPFWQMMEIWMQEGDLKPNKTEVYDGLESINEAVERVREGVSGKKVVVKIA
jgi:NADPH:quinone reductase-like Zn-dependent oxidoreductase